MVQALQWNTKPSIRSTEYTASKETFFYRLGESSGSYDGDRFRLKWNMEKWGNECHISHTKTTISIAEVLSTNSTLLWQLFSAYLLFLLFFFFLFHFSCYLFVDAIADIEINEWKRVRKENTHWNNLPGRNNWKSIWNKGIASQENLFKKNTSAFIFLN